MQCLNWVLMWVGRFEEGGIDALRNLPRNGRPPRITRAAMDNMLSETGILFHVTYVRKLMYRAGLSAKTATMVPANRAGNGTVNSWRHRKGALHV